MVLPYFLFLIVSCSLFSSEKYSLITYWNNSSCLIDGQIDDIHVIYNLNKYDEKILDELEKYPITIHFINGDPSKELCLHIEQTMCKNKQVINDVRTTQLSNNSTFINNPRVTLITSLYNADEFVHDFMKNMIEQSIFSETELIIINAHSPGNEEKEILAYLKEFPNIVYIHLPNDPGLYAIWNMGIRYAHAPLVANANLDDRRDLYSLVQQVNTLEKYAEFDLAYCDFCITTKPNDQWYDMFVYQHTDMQQFSQKAIRWCLPGPQPVWRKSMHEKYGYFREDFISAADQEMWCRAVDKGSQFIKVSCFSGVYYYNPKGISTEPDCPKAERRALENNYIWETYKHLWS
jgi:hypothetical protein